jgi:hypothetical protein
MVQPEERTVIQRLFLLAADPNLGVRKQALFYLCFVPDSIVESLKDTKELHSSQLLLSGVQKDDIRPAFRSKSLFDQRMAVAATVRNFGDDEAFIQETVPLLDDETIDVLSTIRKLRGFCVIQ